jgi:hypothetical protein
MPFLVVAQFKPDIYVSNLGNDSFPGTSNLLPKKTIAGIAPYLKNIYDIKGRVKIGLKEGDLFNENLITSYPIEISSYNGNNDAINFAVLNGTKEFSTGWIRDPGNFNTYHRSIAYTGFLGYGINSIGQYSFIYVFEIDKELEKKAPFTARKLLTFSDNITSAENNPGSFYTPVTNENPIQLYIHTSDGSSPNNNKKYRYEVTVRDWGINSTYQQNNRFENLWVRGFGAGNGMLPGGNNSYYNKIIFGPGAGIHHLVVRSGIINHSLFLPGAKNTGEFALVFYDTEGLGRHNTVRNSIFLDIASPFYSHTSLPNNYGAVEMDSIAAFADTLKPGPFMFTSNTDTVLLKNIYAEGFYSGYNYGNAKYAAISNSCFKDVVFGIAFNNPSETITAKVENVLIKTKGTASTHGIIMHDKTILRLTGSVVYITNNGSNAVTGSFISGSGNKTNNITATQNIFICDVSTGKIITAATVNTDNGIASSTDSWDNNVYILLKGGNIEWRVTNTSTNEGKTIITSFENWKKQSGQDRHSIFFDLRNDPRGLKAIFKDPYNGNYNLANTIEGLQITALGAGMRNPVSCFLNKPSYEEAVEMLRNNTAFFSNGCKNPCNQNSINVNAAFSLDSINNNQIQLNWNISEQRNIEKYIVLRSVNNAAFTRAISVTVKKDSIYRFIDYVQPDIYYKYRLMVVAKTGDQCYSDIRSIKITGNKSFTIYPDPSSGKISVLINGFSGKADFTVINSNGKIIFVKEAICNYSSCSLDLSRNAKGIYWLKVETVKGITVQKFILQ